MALREAESTITLYLSDKAQTECIYRLTENLKKTDASHRYGSLEITTETVDDSAWTDTWKQYYRPIEISDRLAVVPEWENFSPKLGQTVLRMDPGAAFGTGSHETTAMCLGFLSDMEIAGKTVLDVGCGSGILSVAALLLGADSAVGVDIDPLAVKMSGENAALNGVQSRAAFKTGDLTQKVTGCFDIVLANIVADVILKLLKDIKSKMKPDGKLIVSGIIDERSEEIKQALKAGGFMIEQAKRQRDWNAFLCSKETI